jgi:hypothetical protein
MLDTFHFIEGSRLPPGVATLSDPSSMLRVLCVSWYMHVLRGQRGLLSPDHIPQFCVVLGERGTTVATYNTLCTARHPKSTLTWGTEEKLYGQYLDKSSGSNSTSTSWNGLPCCRLAGLYQPLSQAMTLELDYLKNDHIDLARIAAQLIELERMGPSHVSTTSYSASDSYLTVISCTIILSFWRLSIVISPLTSQRLSYQSTLAIAGFLLLSSMKIMRTMQPLP